jgi:DNA-directed RNA polymerase subunit RPC12/RpoP
MKSGYQCLKCNHEFSIELREGEAESSLAADRTDTCPQCGQRVGWGTVTCRNCGNRFDLEFGHWHVHCDHAAGDCAACGVRYVSLCIC